jgi:S-formylglutathione hydrolase FrmB
MVSTASLWAYDYRIVEVPSAAMNKSVAVSVITPDSYVGGVGCYDVVYLLHGFGDNYQGWTAKGGVAPLADLYNLIFVCPDGAKSWYWDSPEDSSLRYETFISKELVEYADTYLSAIPDRSKRAITGLSMGGHGAMWNAIRNKDVFGAVGSISGGLDIRPFPNNWGMSKYIGKRDENLEVWNNYTVINQLDRLKNGDLAIAIDCGVSDFFYGVNKAVHERLLLMKIDHDFTSRPGAHNGTYWSNAVQYQILFFKNFFDKEQ